MISLIFLDIDMPVMNGFAALERINSLINKEATKNGGNKMFTKIIICSAYENESEKEEALKQGAYL